ncbi:MAG: hypothetical protein R3327_02225 [Nitrosopumilaceae archaeon]|nr:hypothetical protein [Nitrosopumilaceae archaeon]
MSIFIAFGVVSGFAFGSYLIDLKNTNELIFVEGTSLTVFTDMADYKLGDNIKIRIINSGSVPLTFSNNAYGLEITGLSGRLLYSPDSVPNITKLEPHDEVHFIWNQIKNNGEQVLEGVYKVSAQGIDPNGNNVKKSTTVTIWK